MRRDVNAFRERFKRWKAGELVYDRGLVVRAAMGLDGEEVTDAILRRQLPLEYQGATRRTTADINQERLAQVMAQRQASIGPNQNVPKLLQEYYKLKDETAKWAALKKAVEEGTDEMMKGLISSVVSPENLVVGGAIGGAIKGVKAAVQGTTKALKNYRLAKAIDRAVTENSTISAYNRNPAIMDTGSLWDYQTYLQQLFPESKIKDILWHGSTQKDLLRFSTKVIGSNTPIEGSTGMYLAPEKATAANYGSRGGVYPVKLNSKNPYITNQLFALPKNGVNVAKISPRVRNTVLRENDAVIAPKRGEIAFFDPNDALILGSNEDLQEFRAFMNTTPRGLLSNEPLIAGGVLPNPFGRIETQMVDFGDNLKTLEHWLRNVPDKDFYDAIGVSKMFFKDRYKNDEKFLKFFRQNLNKYMFNKSLTDISATPEVMLERSKLTHLFNSDWYKSHLDGMTDKDAFIRSQLLAVDGVPVFSYKVPKIGVGGYYEPDPIGDYGKVFIDDNIKNGGLFYSAQRSGNIGHELGHAAGSYDLIHSNKPAILEEGSYQASKPEYYADYDETRTRFLNIAANELWESRNPDLVFDRRMGTIPNSNYADVLYGYNREFAKRYMQTFKSLFPYLIGGGLTIPKLNK